jgi:hypothetical protein
MRTLRYLFALALALGLTSSVAKADDFHMIVVDPVFDTDFPILGVTNLNTLSITLSECEESSTPGGEGQLPTTAGSNYDGCFSFENKTGQTITSMTISVGALVPGQTATCDLSLLDSNNVNVSIFSSNPVCDTLAAGYLLTFTGGSITPGEVVTIAEGGVAPGDFPATTATLSVLSASAATPEPSSLALMSTGGLMMGYLIVGRRKFALLPTRR